MNKNRNSANIRLDKKLSTDARDCSQMFSCAYMMFTLLANVQSQDCEANSKVTLSARGGITRSSTKTRIILRKTSWSFEFIAFRAITTK